MLFRVAIKYIRGDVVMSYNYIVRLKNDKLLAIYYAKGSILCKKYINNQWSGEQILIEDAREQFSVTLNEQGNVYLICQNIIGNMLLCTDTSGEFQSKVILENTKKEVYNVLMTPLISENGFCLVYNVLNAENGNSLIFQKLDEKGGWSTAEKIDDFSNMHSSYEIQPISREHVIIFYRAKKEENTIYYRELTMRNKGGINTVCSSNFRIVDTSFLITQSEMHTIYIVKSLFSTQLYYRKNDEGKFKAPILLMESQNLSNCIVYFVNCELHVTCLSNNGLFTSISKDNGRTFSKVSKNEFKISSNCTKATYISFEQQDESKFYARQIYVNKDRPYDVQLIPNIYKEFYPVHKKDVEVPFEMSNFDLPKIKLDKVENADFSTFAQSEDLISGKVEILKNKLDMYNSQIIEKDKQIIELTRILKLKNEEIMQLRSECIKVNENHIEHGAEIGDVNSEE